MQAYSNPSRESDPHALPDVEIFEAPFARVCDGCGYLDLDADAEECDCDRFTDQAWSESGGWYWWTCSPGCLPDSDPFGPFETEAEALADAQADSEERS